MSDLAATRVSPVPVATGERLHRLLLVFSSLLAVGVNLALVVYGFDYYTLDQAHRALSPKHLYLKPSGIIGIRLGVLGVCLFLLIYLYAIRKRWHWLARKGNSKHWLDLHVLMGLTAPAIITFHAAFKFHGIAGVAYWIMVAVALSGFVGRYIYAQIPRRLDDAEMSFKEMQDLNNRLTEQLACQKTLTQKDIASLLRFPTSRQVESMSLVALLWRLVTLDFSIQFRVWNFRRKAAGSGGSIATLGGLLSSHQSDLERVIVTVRGQASLSKKILFLSKTRQLFHLWHVIHRPFSYSFAILAGIHIGVVLLLGYF